MQKSFSFQDALYMVVGNMIGTGIFAASPLLLQYTPSTGFALILWGIAGIIAYSGAMCFAELALLIPNSGSEGIYIQNGFKHIHIKLANLLSFLFSWSAIILMKPASLAVMCDIFSMYLSSIFTQETTVFKIKFISLVLISILSFIAYYSTILSKNVNNTMFIIKSSLVAWIILAGLFANVFDSDLCKGEISFYFEKSNLLEMFTIGLFDAGFAFDGWSNLNYMASEIHRPEDLISALQIGIPLVGISYLFLNLSYFIVLDAESILQTSTVADLFGNILLGDSLGVIIPFFISLSALGAINGAVLSNSRLIYVAALQGDVPSVLGYKSVHLTPSFALLFNWILCCIYIAVGNISSLLSLFSPFYYGFLCLSSISLVLIRNHHPKMHFQVNSILHTLFIFSSLFLWIIPLYIDPIKWIAGLFIILSGIVLKIYLPKELFDTFED
eukprot:NODE_139_length_16235_cov_0.569038.p5 type:complete len:443 gc:universal NODE_139_length_16235_cov_0.569038:3868-2540(-)